MASWVECTSAVGSGVPVWVNLDQVIAIAPSEQGAEIKGTDGFTFAVVETPGEILKRDESQTSV